MGVAGPRLRHSAQVSSGLASVRGVGLVVVVWQGAINHNQKNPVDLARGASIGPDAHVRQWINGMSDCSLELLSHGFNAHSATGTRTRVARVRAEYPNQLEYSGS